MKKQVMCVVLALVIMIGVMGCATLGGKSAPSVIGKWTGSSRMGDVTMELLEDGTLKFISSRGEMKAKYSVDYSKTPIEFDMFGFEGGPGGDRTMPAIIKFVDKDTMLMQMSFGRRGGGERPTEFTDDATEYKRVKE